MGRIGGSYCWERFWFPELPYTDEVEELMPWETMAWSAPRYSRGQVDAAGEILIHPPPLFALPKPASKNIRCVSIDELNAIDVINNWRASHNWPLYAIRKTLQSRAKRITPEAVIAQRIKRLTSIRKKLQANEYRHLKLSKIQDIGGCRAVMPTVAQALALRQFYDEWGIQSEFVRADDYIANPKPDGYRSVHLIYKYRSESELYSVFNNHRIEIQIRSQLQHAWATALETVETFTGMELRRKAGTMLIRPIEYLVKWRRFFVLVASAIAFREGQPTIPGAPENEHVMLEEVRGLGEELHVVQTLMTWTHAVNALDAFANFKAEMEEEIEKKEKKSTPPEPYWFLLQLDPKEGSSTIKAFRKEDNLRAFDEYVNAEQPLRDAPSTQVVLVSVDSIAELKSAYPNYFADTTAFVAAFTNVRDHNNARIDPPKIGTFHIPLIGDAPKDSKNDNPENRNERS